VYVPARVEDNEAANSFYEDIRCVFDWFYRYHMKILFQDFIAGVM
jgi:hypothetical protein